MVQVNAKITDVNTVHTAEGSRLDQPFIEITLEVNKVGETEKYKIKFSEMLSNIAGKTDPELLDMLEGLVSSYVGAAYKGQQEVELATGEWNRASLAIGKEFIVEI